MKLTEDNISEIVEALHDELQFFDPAGKPANCTVIEQIEAVLRREFGILNEPEKVK